MNNSFEIKRCRLCNSNDINEIINLGNQPLANSLQNNKNSKTIKYPLVLCKCNRCGIIQLTVTVEPKILFSEYLWVTGTSQGAKNYSKKFFSGAVKYLENNNELVVEIASNDGTFLKQFKENGFNVLGVDPAKNIAKIANKSGIKTIADFFSTKKAKEIQSQYGKAGLVFARNVIPHVPSAKDIVNGISICLKRGGIGVIEFHRADIIFKELHYDSIYHEHIFYYSIKSLTKLLSEFDLYPFDIITSPISGGSFVIYFSNLKREKSIQLQNAEDEEMKLELENLDSWKVFASNVENHALKLKKILTSMKRNGKKIIGYGASARSSTLLNYCNISTESIECIIDQSELKHGLFTAGTKIPIKSPSEGMKQKPDVILLLAWNFKDEILEQLKSNWKWSGEIIIPLPGDPNIIKI